MPSQNHLITLPSGIPSQSLWHKALETLDEELKTSLDFKEATHGDILSAALKVAQEKKQVCVQKRWTLKKRNGEIIILRDVVEKIIVWVEKFIAVGDAAMQYDPGHAAPAWTAFRFVLQVVSSWSLLMIRVLTAVRWLSMTKRSLARCSKTWRRYPISSLVTQCLRSYTCNETRRHAPSSR
jgi:hypothetical protein